VVVAGIFLFITMVLSRLPSSQYLWFFFEKTTKEESLCLTSVKVKLVMSFTFVSLASLYTYITIFAQI
jgi:hypothetical protein